MQKFVILGFSVWVQGFGFMVWGVGGLGVLRFRLEGPGSTLKSGRLRGLGSLGSRSSGVRVVCG